MFSLRKFSQLTATRWCLPRQDHGAMHSATDDRVSLQLSAGMKREQLVNMRSHLDAIQTITGLVVAGNFDRASRVAHLKLGMTEEMRPMCNSFDNEGFKTLGLAFHESGDVLGDVLQTRDMNKSLKALETTMGYCVQCSATPLSANRPPACTVVVICQAFQGVVKNALLTRKCVQILAAYPSAIAQLHFR